MHHMQESTKRHILIGLIVISLMPAILLPHLPSLISVSSVSLYLSAIFGYVGIVLLLWMYILGARAITSIFFSDLAPVLKIHKWLGKYGTLAIFVHPLLVTWSYGESIIYSFIPLVGTWSERHILLGQLAFWILLTIWFLSALVRDKISWRTWKYLHYLAYICVPFVLLHIPELGTQQRSVPLVNAYLFTLIATYAIVTLIRIVSFINVGRTAYAITRHTRLTSIDYMMQLEPVGTRSITPKLGQYVYVKLGFVSEDHPFSVAQFDVQTGALMVAYRLSGMYTKELARVPVGSKVMLSGPYGSFTRALDRDARPVVYIAGGIGVTPFVGRILQDAGKREQWLFAANRSRDLAVLRKPLKDTLGRQAVWVYSRESQPLMQGEESGHITAGILRKYLGDLSNYQYCLCGPPAMMESMRHMLTSAGIAPGHVMSEEFGW